METNRNRSVDTLRGSTDPDYLFDLAQRSDGLYCATCYLKLASLTDGVTRDAHRKSWIQALRTTASNHSFDNIDFFRASLDLIFIGQIESIYIFGEPPRPISEEQYEKELEFFSGLKEESDQTSNSKTHEKQLYSGEMSEALVLLFLHRFSQKKSRLDSTTL